MFGRPGRTLAGFVVASALAVAPSAQAAGAQVNAEETQCAGVATWVKTGEGRSGGTHYGNFTVSFPSLTAACSWYGAAATSSGGVGHYGEPVGSGPYTMYLHCTSTVAGQWQVPYVCDDGYSLSGVMEWATGATTLSNAETGSWKGAVDITFGPRILPTGSGNYFPASRWTSTFVLTGDFAAATTW